VWQPRPLRAASLLCSALRQRCTLLPSACSSHTQAHTHTRTLAQAYKQRHAHTAWSPSSPSWPFLRGAPRAPRPKCRPPLQLSPPPPSPVQVCVACVRACVCTRASARYSCVPPLAVSPEVCSVLHHPHEAAVGGSGLGCRQPPEPVHFRPHPCAYEHSAYDTHSRPPHTYTRTQSLTLAAALAAARSRSLPTKSSNCSFASSGPTCHTRAGVCA